MYTKPHTSIITIVFTFLFCMATLAQQEYPVPPKETNHLFYIQHSDNHNTYVYSANMKNGTIDKNTPVDAYRIVYTEGGIKKPLSAIQKRLAYGMITKYIGNNAYTMHLAASKKLVFHLQLVHGKPRVHVTINNHKMYLNRMFIQLKSSGLAAKAEYVIFYGEDVTTHKLVTEKVVVED